MNARQSGLLVITAWHQPSEPDSRDPTPPAPAPIKGLFLGSLLTESRDYAIVIDMRGRENAPDTQHKG
jgi:hypothetical protein